MKHSDFSRTFDITLNAVLIKANRGQIGINMKGVCD